MTNSPAAVSVPVGAGAPAKGNDARRENVWVAVFVIVLLVAAPWIDHSYRFLSVAISTGIATIALYGLGILFGQTGLLSIAHAALMGVGAYTSALLYEHLGLGFWASIPFAMVTSALIAAVLGLCSLRVSGHHFIIITFAFGALFSIVMTNGGSLTGAAAGLDVGQIGPVLGINLAKILNFYYLTVFLVLCCILAAYLIRISAYGRTLRSIRENEVLAKSIGINTNFHKIGAFALSGVFAGLAGVLQAYFLLHISPTLYGTFPSVYLALMVMLGGPRMLYGPLGGAIIVNFLPEVLHLDPVDARIVYGVALVAVIMLLPGGVIAGLIGMYHKLGQLLTRSRGERHHGA